MVGKVPMPPRRVVPVSGDRGRDEKRRQREADTLFRMTDHPLRDNLGSRNVPRKKSGR